MIDVMTHKPLSVSIEGSPWPYLIVPLEQLDAVTTLFDANQVRYEVEEEVLSMDGKPEVAFVDFPRDSDPAAIQRLLDSVP